jgi:rubrerythrin
MDLEEAIKIALEFEHEVTFTYEEARDKTSDPVGKRIFGLLATEEKQHVAYLKACLERWKKTGKVTEEVLESSLPPKCTIEYALATVQDAVKNEGSASPVEMKLLEQAVKAEEKTSDFYKRLVSELDEDGRALFARFVEIEEGHLTIVRAELDAVSGSGCWFDVPEWRFSDG